MAAKRSPVFDKLDPEVLLFSACNELTKEICWAATELREVNERGKEQAERLARAKAKNPGMFLIPNPEVNRLPGKFSFQRNEQEGLVGPVRVAISALSNSPPTVTRMLILAIDACLAQTQHRRREQEGLLLDVYSATRKLAGLPWISESSLLNIQIAAGYNRQLERDLSQDSREDARQKLKGIRPQQVNIDRLAVDVDEGPDVLRERFRRIYIGLVFPG